MSSYSTQNVSVLSLRQQIFKNSFFDQDDHKRPKQTFQFAHFFSRQMIFCNVEKLLEFLTIFLLPMMN